MDSAYIRPSDIGRLKDDERHLVSFARDARHGWAFSEPKAIGIRDVKDVIGTLAAPAGRPWQPSPGARAEDVLRELRAVVPRSGTLEPRIRDTVRARRRIVSVDSGSASDDGDAVEQSAVARGLALVGLGVSLRGAQVGR